MSGGWMRPEVGMELCPTPRALRRIGQLVAIAIVGVALALAFAPWQQSVRGTGRVIAHAPLERRQTLEAPIAGRVVEWAVGEGDAVEAGQLVAVISDNDPELASRLERSHDAAVERLAMARRAVEVYGAQVEALEAAQSAAGTAARRRIEVAQERRAAAVQARDAAAAAKRTADLNLTRQRALADKGLSSTRNVELAELAAQTATADLERADAGLRAARSEVEVGKAERRRIEADSGADIEKARAGLHSAEADAAKYEGDVAQREVEVARQHTMRVTAPRAGTILRLLAKQGGEFVGAGDPIAVLVPTTQSRAVEVWVDGNDVPMIAAGREVRLQLEGWPAVQFVGWPSVAVGTFPGVVTLVDSSDDGRGRFRVVVVPDEQGTPWPDAAYLRQGVRANAWVLLDRVTLGFELWRQWNGFPPVVAEPPGPAHDDATPPTQRKSSAAGKGASDGEDDG